jgi:ParB family transcriptional regulator, chromosome partitioning protein
MPKALPAAKIALTEPTTIPLDKLEIHEGNVRQIKAGVSVEALAADIGRRGLLQSLSVRPILDNAGKETGRYGVQAGGRRLRALQLLAKQKYLAKNAPVPCIVRSEGFVEADSLAENTEREALHPIDQFRAFAALRDKGQGEDTIAAAFGVTPAVVKQRLRLAKASPVLIKAYEDEAITLEQLMAFCLTDDTARQEQVYDAIKGHWNNHPDAIRRMLTEKTVRADDPRAVFLGADAYKAAGGIIIRDLFDEDEGGYLQDVALLERLAGEKLEAEAGTIRAEGWKWVECAIEFPWNHKRDYLPIKPKKPALTDAEQEEFDTLANEHDELAMAEDDLSEHDQKRLNEVIARIDELDAQCPVFETKMIAKGGVFISLGDNGKLTIDRGYIQPDDIKKTRAASDQDDVFGDDEALDPETGEITHHPGQNGNAADNDESGPDIPDRLMIELTAHHSLALREALSNDPGMAYLAMLHALTLRLFYRFYTDDTCLQVEAKHNLTSPFPGLADAPYAKAIDVRHRQWEEALPKNPKELWAMIASLDTDNREVLFAHCVGLTINAVYEPYHRISGKKPHALQLATALKLDMASVGWVTRAGNYFSRVTKTKIIEAVREAKGDEIAALLDDLKKKEMAQEAERLIDGTRWLPEPLRTPAALDEVRDQSLPAFLDGTELQAAE